MQGGSVRYRWDRIAGVGGTLVLLCFLLVAWISPDEPEAEPELEHPGEAAVVPQIEPPASVPQQQSERPEPSIKDSMDINDFDISFAKGLNLEDGCSTLNEFTAYLISEGLKKINQVNNIEIKNFIICGGGRKNKKEL